MYYEEKWIDGVLHYRTSPRDEFRPVQVTQAWLSERATPPAGAGEAERIDAAAKALFVGEGHPEAEWLTRCNVEPWRQKARAILAAPPPLPEAVRHVECVRNALAAHGKGLGDDWQDFIAEQIRDLNAALRAITGERGS